MPKAIARRPLVGFFPGSTIGNFAPAEAVIFLRTARSLLGHDARFVLGCDLTRSPGLLGPAYDDSQGVTGAFNLNLLSRLNRELGANFDRDRFVHRAVWNGEEGRMEMHLVSVGPQAVRVGPLGISFDDGETIHTENSYKHSAEAVVDLAARAGWRLREFWTGRDPAPPQDAAAEFGVFLLDAASEPAQT